MAIPLAASPLSPFNRRGTFPPAFEKRAPRVEREMPKGAFFDDEMSTLSANMVAF